MNSLDPEPPPAPIKPQTWLWWVTLSTLVPGIVGTLAGSRYGGGGVLMGAMLLTVLAVVSMSFHLASGHSNPLVGCFTFFGGLVLTAVSFFMGCSMTFRM
jgi:hypothetical protein